jgi:hypothetical protein
MNKTRIIICLAALTCGSSCLAGEMISKAVTAPAPDSAQPWRFSFALPGWVTWQAGSTGINGSNARLKLGPNDVIPKVDLAAVVRADAHKGRFGIMAEYSYFDISDGIGVPGLVKKLDTRTDQHLGELALSWRIIEGERGWVDLFAGARWTNMYQELTIHPDDGAIEVASQRFADTVVDKVVAAVKAALQTAVDRRIANGLAGLQNRKPLLPQGPLGDAVRAVAAARVQTIVNQREAELRTALQSKVQSRIDEAKKNLSNEVAGALKDELNKRLSRTDQWVDPYVGLKARYYLTKPLYLTARADIGGFDVGAKISWQVNAGIGCQLSRHVFSELTGRCYYVDYDNDGLFYRTLTYGVELTTGINF